MLSRFSSKAKQARLFNAISNTSPVLVNRGIATTSLETGPDMKDGQLQFTTLHEVQKNGANQWPTRPLFGTHATDKFDWMSYSSFDEKVNLTRSVLLNLGIKPGDTVGVISNNRWEWAAIASACYSISAVMVPMYEAQLPSDWSYILNDAGCANLFVANQGIYDRAMKTCKVECPQLKNVLCLDAEVGEAHSFKTVMGNVKQDKSTILAPKPSDLANLIYTSGTTGKPKGVELSHANQVSNIIGTRLLAPDLFRKEDRSLSFLPWAHSYGQTGELWCLMAHGSALGVCRGVPVILEDMQFVKPNVLFSVPTLYKRVYDGVQNLIENESPIKKTLMKTALDLGAQKAKAAREGGELGMIKGFAHKKLDALVLSKIRDRFGGEMRMGFVAGAACPSDIVHFMDSIGIPICEGYGLTETSPVVSISSPQSRQIGSVGRAIVGVDVFTEGQDGERLGKGVEGELCVSGPNIMQGYHNKKDATDEVVIVKDGVRIFHTGDIGKVNEDGFIYITGRLKEQFKLENGKYVVPTPIEESIGMSRFITQSVLYGDNKPHNVILIVPDYLTVRSHMKIKDEVTNEEICLNPEVNALIMSEIALNSKGLKKFEIPQKVHLVAEPFTVENQMMTPKMSIRRAVVMKNYAEELAALYH